MVNADPSYPRLLGDIGGTNARFAWKEAADAPLDPISTYAVASHPTLLDAIRHYLDEHRKPSPRACSIGIANPITGDEVRMTNHHWSFSTSAVQQAIGAERMLVINDFTALALALPALAPDDLRQVGSGAAVPRSPCGLIGPGTGLGVSGLLPATQGPGMTPINGEGGHVSLAGIDSTDDAIIAVLRRRFGHASAERALSGPGLVNLYQALGEIRGEAAEELAAPEISARAVSGVDSLCVAAVEVFLGFLGNVAGNLALTLGARGGVYVGGGIVPRLGDLTDNSGFRQRFEGKGRFAEYLRGIPTFVVQARTSPALLGADRALDEF